ncbi:MAG: hypothetical protein ACRCX2_29665 [Paraclostridium sp.]
MRKCIVLFSAILLLSACSVTITKTVINVSRSDNVKSEVLQEQKSDTAQSANGNSLGLNGGVKAK